MFEGDGRSFYIHWDSTYSELQMGIDSATLRDLVGVKQTQLSP